jgi:hypothetical protein
VSECDQVQINNLDTYCEQVSRRGQDYDTNCSRATNCVPKGTRFEGLLNFVQKPKFIISPGIQHHFTPSNFVAPHTVWDTKHQNFMAVFKRARKVFAKKLQL